VVWSSIPCGRLIDRENQSQREDRRLGPLDVVERDYTPPTSGGCNAVSTPYSSPRIRRFSGFGFCLILRIHGFRHVTVHLLSFFSMLREGRRLSAPSQYMPRSNSLSNAVSDHRLHLATNPSNPASRFRANTTNAFLYSFCHHYLVQAGEDPCARLATNPLDALTFRPDQCSCFISQRPKVTGVFWTFCKANASARAESGHWRTRS